MGNGGHVYDDDHDDDGGDDDCRGIHIGPMACYDSDRRMDSMRPVGEDSMERAEEADSSRRDGGGDGAESIRNGPRVYCGEDTNVPGFRERAS